MKKRLTKVYCALRHTVRVACKAIAKYQESCPHDFGSWRIVEHIKGNPWWFRECRRCEQLECEPYRGR